MGRESEITKEINNTTKFPNFLDLKKMIESQPIKKIENKTGMIKDKISDDKKRWNIFLTLQGNDQKTPATSENIITPLEHIKGRLVHSGIYDYFKSNNSNKILVIGAGDGGEVKVLKEQGFDVIGTTLHWSDKKFAKNFYDVELYIEDFHDMSFTRGTFDGIYSHHSLEHTISPLIALFEIKRVLKNSGRIYITVPESGTGNETGIQHYSVLTETLWRHLLDIIGFKDIKVWSDSGNTTMTATKDAYKECPGKHFQTELIKERLYK